MLTDDQHSTAMKLWHLGAKTEVIKVALKLPAGYKLGGYFYRHRSDFPIRQKRWTPDKEAALRAQVYKRLNVYGIISAPTIRKFAGQQYIEKFLEKEIQARRLRLLTDGARPKIRQYVKGDGRPFLVSAADVAEAKAEAAPAPVIAPLAAVPAGGSLCRRAQIRQRIAAREAKIQARYGRPLAAANHHRRGELAGVTQ